MVIRPQLHRMKCLISLVPTQCLFTPTTIFLLSESSSFNSLTILANLLSSTLLIFDAMYSPLLYSYFTIPLCLIQQGFRCDKNLQKLHIRSNSSSSNYCNKTWRLPLRCGRHGTCRDIHPSHKKHWSWIEHRCCRSENVIRLNSVRWIRINYD